MAVTSVRSPHTRSGGAAMSIEASSTGRMMAPTTYRGTGEVGGWAMRARRALVFAGLLVTLFLVRIGPADAATIAVTTTSDETSANGQTSLREAFATANTNGQNDTIQLQAGATYNLTLCASGPLTHSAVHALTIQGGAGTRLHNTCNDAKTIVDDDDTAGLTVNSLEMTGVTVGPTPFIDGVAVDVASGGPLTLNGVDIHDFAAGD